MSAPRGPDIVFNPEDYYPERDSDWDWQSCPECGKTETLAADEANLQDVYVLSLIHI